jgi:hypothetical protein
MDLNRRSFLKGAFATGAVAAAMAMPGCSPAVPSAESVSGSSNTSGGANNGGKHTWEIKPEAITEIAETKDYDIVIVGAGLAGLSAAEAAARSGASVAVLEQTGEFQVRGLDVGHIGSKWQIKNGINLDPKEAARLLHQWSHQTTNYNLINTWATRSGKVFDYMEELAGKYGISMVTAISPTAKQGWNELEERWKVLPDAVSFTAPTDVGLFTKDGRLLNHNLGYMLEQSSLEYGAEYFFNTFGEQLVGDAASGITGVIAKGDSGYIQFNAAKGVILATGDFGANEEMCEVFAPIVKRVDGDTYTPPSGNTGQGLLMGAWAGAAFSKAPAAPMVHQFTTSNLSSNLTSFVMTWLAVDKHGRRYGAELPYEPYLTNARMNTDGNIAWSIFDADYEQYVQKQYPGTYKDILVGQAEELERRISEVGDMVRADTLEELAKLIDVPADELKKTVERFNGYCQAGADPEFGVPSHFLSEIKTPPFYASVNAASKLVIPFGLHVNDDSQVCTDDDKPIDGLFAIGNMQGDFFAFSYPVACPGVSHGRCVTFGQLVGEALAKDTVITATA